MVVTCLWLQVWTAHLGAITPPWCKCLLTFPQCIAHCGTTGHFSLPATPATCGWQAPHHSLMHHTPVCGTSAKNSTARLLIVKWIQLLLVFSWGLRTPQGVINLDPAFSIATPSVLEQRYHLQEFPTLSLFGFLQHCQNILTGRSEMSGKCTNFWNCLHKVSWMTLIVQEMQKSTKGSLKLLYLPVLFLCC